MRDSKTKKLALLSVFLAAALVAGIVERGIPFDFAVPGVRLGLGNLFILMSLYLFRFRDSLALTVMKCILTALFAGSFTSFAYSLSGSILSLLAMAALIRLAGERLSPTGVSAVGAVCHNIGQLTAASVIMGTAMVWTYLPILMVSGIITGVITGLAGAQILPRVRKILEVEPR